MLLEAVRDNEDEAQHCRGDIEVNEAARRELQARIDGTVDQHQNSAFLKVLRTFRMQVGGAASWHEGESVPSMPLTSHAHCVAQLQAEGQCRLPLASTATWQFGWKCNSVYLQRQVAPPATPSVKQSSHHLPHPLLTGPQAPGGKVSDGGA